MANEEGTEDRVRLDLNEKAGLEESVDSEL